MTQVPLDLHLDVLPAAQRRLWDELCSNNNGRSTASLLDIAATKLAVVQVRAEAKDYLDIDALLTSGAMQLTMALAAACKLYGTTFNPQITLKALSYFADGDVASIPTDAKDRLAEAARMVDLDNLPMIVQSNHQDFQ